MEKGSVKFFDGRDNKRFGFITPDNGGDDVFFHYNGFRKFEVDESGRPVFSNTGYAHPAAFPRKDQQVWFVRSKGVKGPSAQPWGTCDDYYKVMQEIESKPNYGEGFLYMLAGQSKGNQAHRSFSTCGTVEHLRAYEHIEFKYAHGPNRDQLRNPNWKELMTEEEQVAYAAGAAKLEKYQQLMFEKGHALPRNIIRVIPNPGMEKMLGRLFRYHSTELAFHHDKSIEIVEIPKQWEYTGVMEGEFLQNARSLTHSEVMEIIRNGKSVFTRSAYWDTWQRTVGFLANERGEQEPVQVALTPIPNTYAASTWEKNVAPIAIHVGWLGGGKDKEGPYAILPDTVKDDMVDALGAELTTHLLTEDFSKLFTPEQFRAAQRRHTGGGWLTLNEVLAVTA